MSLAVCIVGGEPLVSRCLPSLIDSFASGGNASGWMRVGYAGDDRIDSEGS
jgi:hypothetical protein